MLHICYEDKLIQTSDQLKPKPQRIRPNFASSCPPVRKNVQCEYVKHQCWSLGVPDLDCPGNGLCCFNGCNYMCQPSKTILAAGSYHVPPNQAYLVPGKAYFDLHYMTETYKNKPYSQDKSPKTEAETDSGR